MVKKSSKSAVQDPVLLGGRDTDIVFALMGQTKAGKSTLINRLVGRDKMEVGVDMVSCTKHLQAAVVDHVPPEYSALQRSLQGRRIVFLDTPGFDDTDIGDDEILMRIAKWLESSYRQGMLVGGVLYLHDATKDGWTGASKRNLTLFSKICGDDAMDIVSFVTTKWGNVPDSQVDNAVKRIGELKRVHWRPLIANKASVLHLMPPAHPKLSQEKVDNPWDIIYRMVVNTGLRNHILLLQDELVRQRRFLGESEAGREVCMSLKDLLERAKALQKAAREEGVSATDREALEERQREIDTLTEQLSNLRPAMSRRFARFMRKVLGL